MESSFKYTIYSFKETELASGYTYANVYYPPSLISWFAQAPFSLDINDDKNPDIVVPMNRGYSSGIDTRVPFFAFSTTSGKLEYDLDLNGKMPITAGARRAETIYLTASKTNAVVTVAHETGDGLGGDLVLMTESSGTQVQQDLMPTLPSGTAERPTVINSHSLASGDINGDGLEDLLVGDWGLDWSSPGAYALLQKADGSFELSHQAVFDEILHWPGSGAGGDGSNLLLDLHLVDVNNDGYDDLVAGFGHGNTDSYLFINDKGTYSLDEKQALPTSIYGVDNQLHMITLSADFDLDNDQDMVILWSRYVPYYGGNYLQYLSNDGKGVFTDTSSSAFVNPNSEVLGDRLEWTNFWQVLDVNYDGAPDLVGSSGQKSNVGLVYLNDGKGYFTRYEVTSPSSLYGSIVYWGDFDQDKRLDYVAFESTWDDSSGSSSSNYFKVYELGSQLPIVPSPVTGTAGKDKLPGTSGNDNMQGYAGNDQISGGAGNDQLTGGIGADRLTGGSGADIFIFDNLATEGTDKITDFRISEGDMLAFDDSVFTSLAGGISGANLLVGVKVKALDADDYLLFSTVGGKLYYDADGYGEGPAILLAGLKGSLKGLDYTSFAIS